MDFTHSILGSKNAPGFLRPNAPFWNDTTTLSPPPPTRNPKTPEGRHHADPPERFLRLPASPAGSVDGGEG